MILSPAYTAILMHRIPLFFASFWSFVISYLSISSALLQIEFPCLQVADGWLFPLQEAFCFIERVSALISYIASYIQHLSLLCAYGRHQDAHMPLWHAGIRDVCIG